ncbi:hypothetical protein BDP27DRAFT_1429695 [Rhodocollybia butyracea]|uniref:Uncharacterized protein n=1 Tax=Rhodocollybia butyracea TaxID=206335 RepID=A0A9P5TZV4_9AGAR|nr:hypothetical protein BDP27DRAFT_1429695 [Rhodocollybia butyracea]
MFRCTPDSFPLLFSPVYDFTNYNKEKTPPPTPRSIQALAAAKKECEPIDYTNPIVDLLAINAELEDAEGAYASTTERFKAQLSLTQENLSKLLSTRNPVPNVALNASDYISNVTAEKAAVDVLTTPQRSSIINTASASAFKPAKRQTGIIPPTSGNRTSNSSSTASSQNCFAYIPGGIYQAVGTGQNRMFRLIDGFRAPVIQPLNISTSDGNRLYVVYWGHNNMDLVMHKWQGQAGATDGLTDAIYRRFLGTALGEAAYKECRTTGVLAALKNKMDNKHFLVIKGENPGITVVSKGLKWHGGEFVHLIRNANKAQALFNLLEHKRFIVPLLAHLHWKIA